MPRVRIGPLRLEDGTELRDVDIQYETWGAPQHEAVLICHALTGDAHVARHEADDRPGWWDGIVGPGLAINTDRNYVIASNVLGGCYGSTGPNGTEAFAQVSVTDMVEAQRRLLVSLGVTRLSLVIGGSLGGMQALAWASVEEPAPQRVVAIGAAGSLSPMQVAICHAQHVAIEVGLSHNDPGGGLRSARALAMATYRSDRHFEERFGRRASERPERALALESYLDHHGDRLAERFKAESYLVLSRAMALCDWAEAVTPGTVVDLLPIDSDWLFPPQRVRALGMRLRQSGALGGIYPIRSEIGHDAFLADIEATGAAIRLALGAPLAPPVAARGA